ncbi:hypothetical protein BH11PLA2_BH11PLA2_42960 [soil metagenome]
MGPPPVAETDTAILVIVFKEFTVKLLRTMLFVAAVLVGAGTSARADFVIDNFDNPLPGQTFIIAAANSNPTTVTNVIAPGVSRTITLNVTTPPNSLSMTAGYGLYNTNTGPRTLFTMNLDTFSSGTATLAYTFSTAQNFTAAGSALRYLSTADDGNSGLVGVPLSFVIQTASGNLTLNTGMNLTNTFTPSNILLSSFSGTGDLTQVTGFTVNIVGNQAADVALDQIDIYSPPPPNEEGPAPAAAILALLAVPALGLRHRFNKAKVAVA